MRILRPAMLSPTPLNAQIAPRPKTRALSRVVTAWTGSSWAFAIARWCIVVWLVTGPLFHFSDTWQLVINTGTTIVTFLMVFLIQRAQNKDALAIQLKLNELVAAIARRQQPADRRRGADRGRAGPAPPVLPPARRDGEAGHRSRKSHSIEEAEPPPRQALASRVQRRRALVHPGLVGAHHGGSGTL